MRFVFHMHEIPLLLAYFLPYYVPNVLLHTDRACLGKDRGDGGMEDMGMTAEDQGRRG